MERRVLEKRVWGSQSCAASMVNLRYLRDAQIPICIVRNKYYVFHSLGLTTGTYKVYVGEQRSPLLDKMKKAVYSPTQQYVLDVRDQAQCGGRSDPTTPK